ncbi:restriction endonuclease [candidate division WOR-3 bacterium]|nr:restriction endonuclease [candidate division WOR-3 bacterium]
MAKKHELQRIRAGTVINVTSKKQETEVIRALTKVVDSLTAKYRSQVTLVHAKQWYLGAIVKELRQTYPDVEFHYHFETSSIRPDGGILYLRSAESDEMSYPILIAEVKNQGTSDLRKEEGLPQQARGNAIERLGKNLIGLRTALMRETVFPFVCFGYGCDFVSKSYILDRVSTMAMFGKLNTTYLHNEANGRFNRGSFYFRPERWTVAEMYDVMRDIADRSILYYFSKYGKARFASVP